MRSRKQRPHQLHKIFFQEEEDHVSLSFKGQSAESLCLVYALHGHLDFMGFYSKLGNLIIQFFSGLASVIFSIPLDCVDLQHRSKLFSEERNCREHTIPVIGRGISSDDCPAFISLPLPVQFNMLSIHFSMLIQKHSFNQNIVVSPNSCFMLGATIDKTLFNKVHSNTWGQSSKATPTGRLPSLPPAATL